MRGDDLSWDVVVVGSGLGGLTCAGYLAASGRRVLVLEQHDVAGGNGHVFRRRRAYEFDVGVHYLGDCGPGGTIPAILAGLGLRDRVRFRPMDQDGFDHIVMPGRSVDVPAGWDRYRDRLLATFPAETEGLLRYFDVCAEVVRAAPGLPPTPGGGHRIEASTTVAWHRRTLADLFDHCRLSRPARSVLAAQSGNYGLAPSAASVGVHVRMIDHYLHGAYYPEGGGQMLAASLVESLESNGGELWTRCAVSRILVEGGRATGVTLADGRTIRADLVVCNADYRRTVLELAGGSDAFTTAVVEKTDRAVPTLALTVLYVALDTPLPERRNANLWWLRDDDIEGLYARLAAGSFDTVDYLFCSFASLKDPHNRAVCPPGHSNFQLMTLCPPGYERWGVSTGPAEGGRYRRNEVYQREKQRVTDAMLDAAEEALGPFRDRIVHLETATPLSQERYTWSTGGTPYGLGRWGAGVGTRPDTRTTVPGLYVVGQSTRHGSGIGGVMVGGAMCAGQILDRPLLAQARSGTVIGDPAVLPDRPADWDPLAVSRGTARRDARGLARIG
ncbi:phytoene desaturase family protein [Micromonospora sp. NBC_01796]|uniref:phytoene desaturase family protein n=1 Tax=Micromonospora sp. NBC_01796 TaxID=2975987 RepID=UPI002DD9351C|nr:NAD(P)/FAD-dependent oxidoreductase [Micromonospora sp. NBC_01796]WSA85938.1 NAD(P)/FAD-dependent oxidoreductase [Micromonospora sp. NBC_01796]